MQPLIDAHPTSADHRISSSAETFAGMSRPKARLYDWIKLLADFTLALALFVVFLPVMIIAGILVRITSRGPAIYTQTRLGRNGRPFNIIKLRTMFHNCEGVTGAKWATKGDPRVTPLGRLLRKTHVDELPQIWNVLRGEMSLVGPRPERPEIIVTLEDMIPGYRGRLSVKPGVTGLAQIQLPPDTDLDSVRDKLVLDICYVERQGLSLDARIFVGTGLYLFGLSYAGVRRVMALPTGRPDEEVFARALPLKG
jgi:lipopolysaccharide/colanic/teichoic acid biosynthesis glycosyltransferase